MASSTTTAPTLTEVTRMGRNGVKFAIIALVSLMVGRVLLNALVAYWKATFPPPPPAPTVGFGKIPAIEFPEQDSADKPSSYRLEMPTNDFPYFGNRYKVFLIPNEPANLLADEKVRQLAAKYDFIFEPEALGSGERYRWTRSEPLNASFEVETRTLNFVMESDYLARPELLSKKDLPENYEAVTRVKNYLNVGGLLAYDIATSSGRVAYLKALGGEVSEAFSLSDADFLQVDIDRQPIDQKYELYGPDGKKGVVSAILSGAFSGIDSIVALEYHHRPVDYYQVETYPPRDTKSAWQLMQAGEGYVADKGTQKEAVIRSISLGYYESWDEQGFLQPIYIFLGDGGFVGYVPAVDSTAIQKKN